MPDIVSREVRSRIMAGIRGKDTKPEMVVRRGLHRLGFRYRLHATDLPGKPDLVFPKYNAVIFVHGCFWHGHDCHLFRWPSTRQEFWQKKISRNIERDKMNLVRLGEAGWRTAVVWECAMRGKGKLPVDDIIIKCSGWFHSDKTELEIRCQD